MVYVTHDAENLQFYLWMADYFKRFQSAPQNETCLSPKWGPEQASLSTTCSQGLSLKNAMDLEGQHVDTEDISNSSIFEDHRSYNNVLGNSWQSLKPFEASPSSRFKSGGVSSDVQPFRSEVNRIISHYIIPGSPRELNLSHKDRAAVLYALSHTTHPSAFTVVKDMLDATLRHESHPNFIRWSICNGNTPRTFFLRGFAIMNITIGFLIAILLTLSSASRWFRIIAAAEWWFGITNFIAAYQGLCVLLHRLHTRNIRPWEIDDREGEKYQSLGDEAQLGESNIRFSTTKPRWPVKMEVFGPSNNYLKDPWMRRHRRKSLWNQISDRKVRVKEKGLRIMQNKIVWQAEAWALVITIPLTAGFVALPKGNFY